MKIRREPARQTGFTLVEIMVAMVVLAIGLLGMAAMTILVVRGNKGADQITIATQLSTQKIEALKDQGFNNLGTATGVSDSNYWNYGVTNYFTKNSGPVNSLGDLQGTSSNSADYIYYQAYAVCSSSGTFPCTTSTCTNKLCDNPDNIDSVTLIPMELACDSTMAQTNEKRLRVVTYWKDRFNKCHRVPMDTIVVNLTN